jgi:glycosyltransferase involved in cell wall biosynthesis
VQLFNTLLLREMLEEGVRVCLPVERTWARRMESELADLASEARGRLEIRETPGLGGALPASMVAALPLMRRRFDALLLGNVGRGVAPAVRLLHASGAWRRAALIAHRGAQRSFLAWVRGLPLDVVCVNRTIEGQFAGRVGGRVETRYGVAGAERFFPRAGAREDGAPVRFCVLGKLDAPWKGASLAVEAFGALAEETRRRSELHLIAFQDPPEIDVPGVVAHAWRPAGDVPETLRSMDVLIVPSTKYETFSQAIVQGMLTGLPIIASDLPVLAEKLDEGGGMVCATAGEMTAAMERLAWDAALRERMGAAARETALARYVWRTRAFLDEVLLRGRGAGDQA